MVSFGKLLGVPYLLCSNHTIHLAVSDKLFKKKSLENDCNDGHDSFDNSDEEESDEEADDVEETEFYELVPDYQATIKKMREIVKIFRYSPLKSGVLESIQRTEGKKPLKLINDVVTRWNSLVIAGKRFLEMVPSTTQALKHKDIRSSILWSDHDTETLEVFF